MSRLGGHRAAGRNQGSDEVRTRLIDGLRSRGYEVVEAESLGTGTVLVTDLGIDEYDRRQMELSLPGPALASYLAGRQPVISRGDEESTPDWCATAVLGDILSLVMELTASESVTRAGVRRSGGRVEWFVERRPT